MEKLNKITKLKNFIYYNLFIERFNKKINFNFPSDFYRWDMIKFLQTNRNFENYLEIGCDQDQLFSKVNIKNKIGVDPVSGGNVRKLSDNFFSTNKVKFDLVFIDGLHEYKQVKQDITNSLKFLNPDGIILVPTVFQPYEPKHTTTFSLPLPLPYFALNISIIDV